MRRLTWALFIAPVLAALPAPAAAAPGWIVPAPSVSAAPLSNVSGHQIAVGPNGDVAVFFEIGPTLRLTTRPPGGTFSAPVDVTTTYAMGSGKAVAVDAAGTAHLVWTDTSPSQAVRFASMPAGGALASPVTLQATDTPDVPNIVVQPGGDAVAVWRLGGGANGLRMARRPAGGTFGAPFTTYASGTVAEQPRMDINSAGDVALGFRRRIGGGLFYCMGVVQSASSSVASTSVFDPGAPGGAENDDGPPPVGIDNAGNATLLCGRKGAIPAIKVANRPAGGVAWSSIAGTSGTVDATSGNANPRLVMNGAGAQAASWNTGAGAALVLATRSALGTFALDTTVGPASAGVSYSPAELAIDPAGVATAAYNRNAVVRSARTAGTGWALQSPDIDATAGVSPNQPLLGADDQGNAAVAYLRFDGGNANVRATGFDGAGPKLSDILFPASAQAGTSFPFSASASDVWSGVSAVGWSFGQGSTFSGASGTFAYPAAGAFTATVTATDTRGNTSAATRDVSVSGAGPAPPPSPPAGPAAADATAPVISRASLTNRTFSVDRRAKPAAAGTRIRYTLSEPARVAFVVSREAPGRRSGSRCVARTKGNRARRGCTRLVGSGTFGRDAGAGANSTTFAGRIGSRTLKPGRHRIALRARDAAGNRSKVVTLSFRVVK